VEIKKELRKIFKPASSSRKRRKQVSASRDPAELWIFVIETFFNTMRSKKRRNKARYYETVTVQHYSYRNGYSELVKTFNNHEKQEVETKCRYENGYECISQK
jgi:hypothetical protein